MFKCKHPFNRLVVEKDSTVKKHPVYSEDFNIITYYFTCAKCNKKISIKYGKTIAGVDDFIKKRK